MTTIVITILTSTSYPYNKIEYTIFKPSIRVNVFVLGVNIIKTYYAFNFVYLNPIRMTRVKIYYQVLVIVQR